MTYSMDMGRYILFLSDTHFSHARKKPTISIYDKDENTETKFASFNSQETFELFVRMLKEQGMAIE